MDRREGGPQLVNGQKHGHRTIIYKIWTQAYDTCIIYGGALNVSVKFI